MTTNRYFTLTTSTSSLSKRFIVLHQGYLPMLEKATSVKKTLDGKYDISSGGIFERHEYIVKIRDEEEDDDYGTRDDLKAFYMLNNPNPEGGQPSNKLTLEDHHGNSHTVMMSGEYGPQPLGVMMEGVNAVFTVKIVFLFLESEIS